MKTRIFRTAALMAIIVSGMSFLQSNSKPMLKEETITYAADGVILKGFVVYNENKTGKRPGILVVHE